MQELAQFKEPLIFGARELWVDNELIRVKDKVREYRTTLKNSEIIESAQLQIVVRGTVKFNDVALYLERFMEHRVHDVWWNWNYIYNQPVQKQAETSFGTIEYKEERNIDSLKKALEKLVKKQKPLLRDFFSYTAHQQVYTHNILKFVEIRLFNIISGMVLVKEGDYGIRHTHSVIFGCKGDCVPLLKLTSRTEDYADFIHFFKKHGYNVAVSLCVTLRKPKMVNRYVKERVAGYERTELCSVL